MRVVLLPSLIAPIAEGRCYGGAEMVALLMAEGLAARGHQVSMFGIEGSFARGVEIFPASPTPIFVPGEAVPSDDPGPFEAIADRLWSLASSRSIDVLHLHLNDPAAFEMAATLAVRFPALRVISTLHLASVFPATTEAVISLLAEETPITFVAPSKFAAESYGLSCVVPNGVDFDSIQFFEKPIDDRLAWAGRRSAEKGLSAAIAIAERCRRPLVIAGPPGAIEAPPWVVDRGRIERAEVPRLFGEASAVLITSSIAEAHPLVALEALAAGTPLVAFDAGGLREIVIDGVNGFLVPPGDVEAAARVVPACGSLDRRACRTGAQKRFDLRRFFSDYEALYRGVKAC